MTVDAFPVFANHRQWPSVKEVCARLKAAGYQALLAGGCVRDALLGREPHDFDIATDATPEDVEKLFPKSLMVGRAFGVSILPFDGFQLEVTTFRSDGPYLNGRHPSHVTYSHPPEDAARRDFTINALFYDIDRHEVLDFVGGREDLDKGVIRTVGRAEARFEEDKLRVMRAVRFAAQLGFEIEAQTLEAVRKFSTDLAQVSFERIRDELLKLLKTPGRRLGLELLESTGLMATIFPDWSLYRSTDPRVFHEAGLILSPNVHPWIRALDIFARLGDESARDLILEIPPPQGSSWLLSESGLAAVFFLGYFKWRSLAAGVVDLRAGRESVGEQMKRLKFSHAQMDPVLWVFGHYREFHDPAALRVAQRARLLAHPAAPSALELYMREDLAQGLPLERHEAWMQTRRNCLDAEGQLPPRFVTGADLKKLGVAPGQKFGALLEAVYDEQIEGRVQTQEQAIQWLRAQIGKG